MPEIMPFKAYYYNTQKGIELEKVLAPPHDVISPTERITFQQKSPYNIVHLILPDSYPMAAQMLNDFIKNEIVIQRKSPEFYLYGTKILYNKFEFVRYGLITLVRLSDFSEKQIFPHEKTFKKVAEGRLNLIRETNANFNPIFFIFKGNPLYSKLIQKYTKKRPFLETTDGDNVTHMIWVIEDKQDISTLQNYFKPIPLTIADGHHRYLSALIHSQEGGSKYILGLLVDMNDPGLQILPTHRLIQQVPTLTSDAILNRLENYFTIDKYAFTNDNLKENLDELLAQLSNSPPNSFGMTMQNQSNLFLLTLRPNFPPDALIQGDWSADWKSLDVSVLHELILTKLLEIPEEIEDAKNIIYTKDIKNAIQQVLEGSFQLLFILNPTKVEQILKVTKHSELMPHKSTYFYPKPLSGLIFYKYNPNEVQEIKSSPHLKIGSKVTIRKCRKSDQNGIMEVCFRTGYMGEDLRGHFQDKKLFGYLFCLYYPQNEPETCFVADHKGRIVGYILGSPNTSRQERLFIVKMGWRILLRAFFITFWRYHTDFKTLIHFLRLPQSSNPDISKRYPAHLHIDILESYQHRGIGTRLMARYENFIRKLKITGIHLGTSEGNYKAIPFYKKLGYTIIHTDRIGMWPDALEKRGLIFAKVLNKKINLC